MKSPVTEKDWGSLKIGKFQVKTQTLIFILGILGIVLIGLGPILSRVGQSRAEPDGPAAASLSVQYVQDLEARLQEVLHHVEGVGQVKVMVTLQNGYGYEYAKTEKVNHDALEDIKAADSKKVQEKKVVEESFILIEGASGKEPLVTKELEPLIKGVVVVCEGGDQPAIVGKVVETLKVALNISSTQIAVSKLANLQQ